MINTSVRRSAQQAPDTEEIMEVLDLDSENNAETVSRESEDNVEVTSGVEESENAEPQQQSFL